MGVRYLNNDIGIELVDGKNIWQTCLQNPFHMFDLKYCAVEFELLLGSNEVTCAMSVV